MTTHGSGVDRDRESLIDIILRETEEELGKFSRLVVEKMFDKGLVTTVSSFEDSTKVVGTYGLYLTDAVCASLNLVLTPEARELIEGLEPCERFQCVQDFMAAIQMRASSGGLVFLQQTQLGGVRDIREFDRMAGIADRNTVAMFPDELEAVKVAFEKLVPEDDPAPRAA